MNRGMILHHMHIVFLCFFLGHITHSNAKTNHNESFKNITGVGFIYDKGGTQVWHFSPSGLCLAQGGFDLPKVSTPDRNCLWRTLSSTMGTRKFSALSQASEEGSCVAGSFGVQRANTSVCSFVFFPPTTTALGTYPTDSECELSDLVVSQAECLTDSTYRIKFSFSWSDVPSNLFDVYINGQLKTVLPLGDIPAYTVVLPISGFDQDLLTICIQGAPDCCQQVWIDVPDYGLNNSCELESFQLTPTACTNDSFYIQLQADIVPSASDSFLLWVNGLFYGTYAYGSLPTEVGPFPKLDTEYKFEIRDVLHTWCKKTFELDALSINCVNDTTSCLLDSLWVDVVACPQDSSLLLTVQFEWDSTLSNQQFSLEIDTTLFGPFFIDSLPISLSAISWAPGDTLVPFKLCLPQLSNCCRYDTVTFEWCEHPVWPGDANNNNGVDLYDLLHIGLAWGKAGPPRPIISSWWQPWPAADWIDTFANGTNLKYADCNGDGFIDIADTMALSQNYGLAHDVVVPLPGVEASLNDPPLWVDLPNNLQNQQTFLAPIMLGNATHPLDSIYGLAFLLFYDPQVIDPNSVDIVIDSSWLGTPGTDLVSIDRSLATEGILHVAITRTDQQNATGFGQVAGFIGFIDDIWGKQQVTIGIGGIRALTAQEVLVPLQAPLQIKYLNSANDTASTITSTAERTPIGIVVWPNPATQWIHVRTTENRMAIAPKTMELWSVSGQCLATYPQFQPIIDISEFPTGIYILRLITEQGTIIYRIVKE